MSNKIITLEHLQTNNAEMKKWVEGIVAGKVDYLGTVATEDDIVNIYDTKQYTPGDYGRASADFIIDEGMDTQEQVHSGDLIVFKKNSGEAVSSAAALVDIIHTEDPGEYVTLATNQTFAKDIQKTFESSDGSKLTLSGYSMTMTDGTQYINFFPTLHWSSPKNFNFSPYGFTLVGDSYDDGVVDVTPYSISLYRGNVGLSYNSSTDSIIHTYDDELGLQASATIKVPNESGTFATQEWVVSNAELNLNIKSGEGDYSLQQKASGDSKAPQAKGLGSIALGGFRGDKPTGTPSVESDIEEPARDADGKKVYDTITIAQGIQSFAAGAGNTACGDWDAVFGKDNIAYQRSSFVAGGGANQAGYDYKRYTDDNPGATKDAWRKAYSQAFVGGGERNKAVGYASFATGSNNLSRHTNTFTAGQNNEAMGRRSSIFGYSNYTYTENGFVVGQYNARNDNALFQVGNGTGASGLRKNAFEVLKDGRAKVYGAPIDDNDVVRKCDLNQSEPLTPLIPFETGSHVDTLTYAVKNLKLNQLYRVVVQPITRQGVELMDITNGKSVNANFGGSLDFIYYPFGNDNPGNDWYNVMSYGNLYLEVDGVRYGNAHIRTRLTLTASPYPEDNGKNIFAVQVILDSGDPNQLYYFPVKSIRLMEVR